MSFQTGYRNSKIYLLMSNGQGATFKPPPSDPLLLNESMNGNPPDPSHPYSQGGFGYVRLSILSFKSTVFQVIFGLTLFSDDAISLKLNYSSKFF